MMATYLYRTCLAMTDMGYGNYRLHYLRTLDKKEIDFIVARDNRPILAIEVKSSDITLSKPLKDRRKWFPDLLPLGFQVVNRRNILKKYPDKTWVVSIERMLSLLI